MRTDVMRHEISALNAEDAAEIAVAAISRIGQLGRDAGEAFKVAAADASADLAEGLAQLQAD